MPDDPNKTDEEDLVVEEAFDKNENFIGKIVGHIVTNSGGTVTIEQKTLTNQKKIIQAIL